MRDLTRRQVIGQAVVAPVAAGLAHGAAGAATGDEHTPQTTGTNENSKRQKLRSLLRRPEVTLVPEVYSSLAARLAQLRGFEAVYIGGNLMSAMYLGLEDWGLITGSEMTAIGGLVAAAVDVPTIVDADQLGENALNAYRGIREYERAGIAAMHMEDTRNPKHLGKGVTQLMPLEEMALRIAAANEGRTDPAFVIIARTDCLTLGEKRDVGEAIRRGQAYAEAGADAFFPTQGIRPIASSAQELAEIARNVPIPVVGLNVPLADIRAADAPVKMLLHAVTVYQPLLQLYDTMIGELRDNGKFIHIDERSMPADTMSKLLYSKPYRELVDRWRAATSR